MNKRQKLALANVATDPRQVLDPRLKEVYRHPVSGLLLMSILAVDR